MPEFHFVRALAQSPVAAKVRGAMVLETGVDERLHICIEDLRWETTTSGQGVIRHREMLAMTITRDIKVLSFYICMLVGGLGPEL